MKSIRANKQRSFNLLQNRPKIWAPRKSKQKSVFCTQLNLPADLSKGLHKAVHIHSLSKKYFLNSMVQLQNTFRIPPTF